MTEQQMSLKKINILAFAELPTYSTKKLELGNNADGQNLTFIYTFPDSINQRVENYSLTLSLNVVGESDATLNYPELTDFSRINHIREIEKNFENLISLLPESKSDSYQRLNRLLQSAINCSEAREILKATLDINDDESERKQPREKELFTKLEEQYARNIDTLVDDISSSIDGDNYRLDLLKSGNVHIILIGLHKIASHQEGALQTQLVQIMNDETLPIDIRRLAHKTLIPERQRMVK